MTPRIRAVHHILGRAGALVAAIVLAVVFVTSGATGTSEPSPSVPPATPALVPVPSGFVGKAGCSASACHGGPAPSLTAPPDSRCWQGSATHWQACDPHQRAYSLLTDKPERLVNVTAATIMNRLGWNEPATKDSRCLACHTTPSLAVSGSTALRSEGVSCEACHGEARSWQFSHTAAKGGPEAGMTELRDIGVRAKTCVGCHVGAPAQAGIPVRDVNHDMIAAGHPRLDFDFSEHHRRLPKHWQEPNRAKPTVPNQTGPETQFWLVGRLAHAEAACELLASRAQRAEAASRKAPAPWPELAEYNCAACHHAIDPRGNRPSKGWPPWQSFWPLVRPNEPKVSELYGLAGLLSEKRFALPKTVAARATLAAEQLRSWRETAAATPEDVTRFFAEPPGPSAPRDDLAARLHGLSAVQRDRPIDDRDPEGKFAAAFRAFREWNPNATDLPKSERDAREALNDLLTPRQ